MELMDKIKSSFESIKAEFNKIKKESFGSLKTVEGAEIMFEGEMLSVGSAVTLSDGTPAPDGQHDLETGMTITVEGGVVTDIAEGETPEPAQEAAEAQYATVEQFDEAVNTMTQRFEAFESKIQEFEKVVNSLIELAGQSVEAINEFAKETPEPAQKPEPSYVEKQKMAQQENLKSLAQTFSKLKNNK